MSDTAQTDTQINQYVGFTLDGEEYGVPILSVHEIIRYETLTAIPQSAEFIEGVLNLRGQVIPVVNLRQKFDLPNHENDRSTRIVVAEINGRLTGLVVDEVSEVLQIESDQITPPPPMGTTVNMEFIDGMGKVNDKLMILLNINKILSLEENVQVDEVMVP